MFLTPVKAERDEKQHQANKDGDDHVALPKVADKFHAASRHTSWSPALLWQECPTLLGAALGFTVPPHRAAMDAAEHADRNGERLGDLVSPGVCDAQRRMTRSAKRVGHNREAIFADGHAGLNLNRRPLWQPSPASGDIFSLSTCLDSAWGMKPGCMPSSSARLLPSYASICNRSHSAPSRNRCGISEANRCQSTTPRKHRPVQHAVSLAGPVV